MNQITITDILTGEVKHQAYCPAIPFAVTLSPVDIERINLINQLSDDQKDIFALGLGFFAAYLTDGEVRAGREHISESDLSALDSIKQILNRQNLKTNINEQK